MAEKLLTDLQIKGEAGRPRQEEFWLNDGGGLQLRVRPASKRNPDGSREWFFVYKREDKKVKIALGRYPDKTLSLARSDAAKLRAMRADNLDPQAELERQQREREEAARRQQEEAKREANKLTMTGLYQLWQENHGVTLDGHWQENRRSQWRVHLEPVFGAVKVEDATYQVAMRLYDDMVARDIEPTARKVLAFLRQLIKWAVERGHARPDHPLLHIAAPKRVKQVAEDQLPENFDIDAHLAKYGESSIGDDGEDDLAGRALQFSELVTLLHERLPRASQADSGKRLIKLMLATGLRAVEATRLRWNWISFERRLMMLPAGAAKKRRMLHVHLSDYALEQLRAMSEHRLINNDHVFPAPVADGKSIRRDNLGNDISNRQFYENPGESPAEYQARLVKRKQYKRATDDMQLYNLPGGKWTLYDMRRTAATRMEELGISRDIVARVLNHARDDAKTTGRYARYGNWQTRCRALDMLGNALADCEAGNMPSVLSQNVTPLFKSA